MLLVFWAPVDLFECRSDTSFEIKASLNKWIGWWISNWMIRWVIVKWDAYILILLLWYGTLWRHLSYTIWRNMNILWLSIAVRFVSHIPILAAIFDDCPDVVRAALKVRKKGRLEFDCCRPCAVSDNYKIVKIGSSQRWCDQEIS